MKNTIQAWNVYLNHKWINRVFYNPDTRKDEILNGLICHDGYDSNITIRRHNYKGISS